MKMASWDLAKRVLVVAEIGNNHEGNFERAQELVKSAAACGAGAVKFQTFQTDHYVSPSDAPRYQRLESFELTGEQFRALRDQAHSLGLLFISTPFDLESAALLSPLVDAFKIASGDLAFYPLIERTLRYGKPLIISTGASDLNQVKTTIQFIQSHSSPDSLQERLILLHCVSSYPVPPQEANLRAITSLKEAFPCVIGYSDHTLGVEAAALAVALGARLIEKHFTLDKHASDFRDHQISADPSEMQELVRRVVLAEQLLGDGRKRVLPCEEALAPSIRRSIVSARDLPAGEILKESDLTWVRPSGGLAPGEEKRLLGKRLRKAVPKGARLESSDVQ